jgi:hypothetical protein
LGELGQILMKYGLLACGPMLVKHFESIPINGDLSETEQALVSLGKEEVSKRWHAFLEDAQKITSNASDAHFNDTASWIIGQNQSPFPAYSDPGAPKPNPIFLRESIPANLKALALFLTQEKIGKQIENESDEEAWLANEREQTIIGEKISQTELEFVFGANTPDTLYTLLPKELQNAIARLEIIHPLKLTTLQAHSNTELVQLDGQFDKDEKIMRIVISNEQTIERVLETWFHEIGHAMITGNTQIDRDIKILFAKAVAKSQMITNCYASDVYNVEGIERGLEEDFAESFREFMLFPDNLEKEKPERFSVMQEIMSKYCPSFDRNKFNQKMYIFMKNANIRRAA